MIEEQQRQIYLSSLTSNTHKEFNDAYDRFMSTAKKVYIPESDDNEKSAKLADMHTAMARFHIVSQINSRFQKWYASSKDSLDKAARSLGLYPEVINGEAKAMYQNDYFNFSKKRNAEGQSTAIKDFVTELNKLGVDPDTINKALTNATKPKKGSVYYTVTLVDV